MKNYLDKSISGGKGASLQRILELGLNVPEFLIVTSSDFSHWQRTNELSKETKSRVEEFINSLDVNFFAVRSSATSEDGAENSFAGVLETFLYIEKDDIEDKIIQCFKSFYSERILQYENIKATGEKRGLMAVVVQRMIDSDISGVAFSRSPDIDSALVYIESGLGLGEGVVSGLIDVDRYYINRFNQIIKKDISNKESQLKYDATKKEVTTQSIQEQESSLSNKQLLELTEKILFIERSYGHPCDIEWTYSNNELYILQVRPITTKNKPLELFIDTNLSESYPGHTTPITGEYVNLAYAKVHYELAEYIGFDKAKRDKLLPYLNTMTNYVDGHMYYRLESYYNILLSVPGGEQNLKNWHRMIGGKAEHINIKTNVDLPDTKDSIIYYKFIAKIIFKHRNIFKNFLESATKKKDELYRKLNKSQTTKERIGLINFAINTTKGFSLTAFNDVLTMKGLNYICKILEKYNISEDIIPYLIKTEEGVDSLGPLEALKDVSNSIKSDVFFKDLEEAINFTKKESIFKRYSLIFDILIKRGHENIVSKIESFLINYGDRSFEELKLESLTIKQSPELLMQLLKLHSGSSNKAEIVDEVDLNSELDRIGKIDRIIFNYIVKKTQTYIATREACRLIRGEFYGWYRECLLTIFEDLRESTQFRNYETSELFYLSLTDLFNYANGKSSLDELKSTLEENLSKFKKVEDYPEFIYVEEGTNSSYINKVSTTESTFDKNDKITGLSASKGNITGKVLLLKSPLEALDREDLEECILVTQNTDPAWIYIMTKCKGLISEKGSLLSHTAIIGRELGVPTMVGVKNITQILKNVDTINLDANTGQINILN
jgi:pyruvate,water dikinase